MASLRPSLLHFEYHIPTANKHYKKPHQHQQDIQKCQHARMVVHLFLLPRDVVLLPAVGIRILLRRRIKSIAMLADCTTQLSLSLLSGWAKCQPAGPFLLSHRIDDLRSRDVKVVEDCPVLGACACNQSGGMLMRRYEGERFACMCTSSSAVRRPSEAIPHRRCRVCFVSTRFGRNQRDVVTLASMQRKRDHSIMMLGTKGCGSSQKRQTRRYSR